MTGITFLFVLVVCDIVCAAFLPESIWAWFALALLLYATWRLAREVLGPTRRSKP